MLVIVFYVQGTLCFVVSGEVFIAGITALWLAQERIFSGKIYQLLWFAEDLVSCGLQRIYVCSGLHIAQFQSAEELVFVLVCRGPGISSGLQRTLYLFWFAEDLVFVLVCRGPSICSGLQMTQYLVVCRESNICPGLHITQFSFSLHITYYLFWLQRTQYFVAWRKPSLSWITEDFSQE